jgi:hypothetical protein
MKHHLSRAKLALIGAGVLSIYGCGGGSTDTAASASSFTFSGVAATGAAFDGAAVTATDAAGTAISCGTTAVTTGNYTCTIPATATAPFVIEATRAETGESFYSVVAEKKTATVNVTPITTAIVAGLSPTGDPAEFKKEMKADATLASIAKLATQVALLETKLDAVIKAATAAGFKFDPLAGTFTAGSGTGMDKILDAVKVTTTAATAGGPTASVAISLRADPDTVLTIQKGNEAAAVAIPTVAVTAVQTAIDSQPATLIADLLTRMTDCYALPVASRVDNQSTGTSANILASACKTLFKSDDPANFKSGGNTVGAKGAFKGIFTDSATGVKFDRGNLEFVVNNPTAANHGYWVISYRSTDLAGNATFDTFSLIKEVSVAGTKLKQAGNQYDYETSVAPFIQDRDFINASANNYLSTGYTVNLTNKIVGGVSAFSQAVVTSPSGKTVTLKPLSGTSYLGLVQNPGNVGGTEKVLGTNFVRMSYGPTVVSPTAVDYPASEATRLYFVPTKLTDTEIAAIPDQGTWTFDITLADGVTHVIQKNRTTARAPTLAEVRKVIFPVLTTAQKADATSSTTSGYYLFSNATSLVNLGSTTTDAWTVPAGALAPTKVQVFGNLGIAGSGFNDLTNVTPLARKAVVYCGRQSTADVHCASDVTVNGTGFYASGTRITEVQLNAATPRGSISKHNAFYTP